MTWRGLLTLVLLVAALVSGWAAWRQRSDDAPTAAASARPTYLLRDFELIALNAQGKESFTLRAPELAQSPTDETMALRTPLFLLPDKSGARWEIRSRTGWVAADNSEVRLRGNVVANSPPSAAKPTTMHTEELNVFPDKNEATSVVLVTVNAPGSTMRGTGLKADLATQRIQLLSKVTLINEPSRR
ncbi:MAG: LPS export ABC transporter periplasmic protein LptC [Luteimonas sp.]